MLEPARALVLATALLAAGAAAALAQSSPAPVNTSGNAISRSVQGPTDPGLGGASSDVRGLPSTSVTTGQAAAKPARKHRKTVSPAR